MGPEAASVKQVFISYDTEDTELAHRLADDLEWSGVPVWISPDSIFPGESWVDAIERGLGESTHMLVVLTPAAVGSSWVKKETEIGIAQERRGRMRVIPLEVQPCEVPLLLSSYQAVSFCRDYAAGLSQLTDILKLRSTMKPPLARPVAVSFKRLRAINLPAGHSNRLRADIVELVRRLQQAIPAAFDSYDYLELREAIVQEMEGPRHERLKQLNDEVSRRGFELIPTKVGLVLAPLVDGQILSPEQYAQLAEDHKSQLEAHRQDLQRELSRAMWEVRALEKKIKEKLRDLDREIASHIIANPIGDLKEKYGAFDEVIEYLDEMQNGLIANVSDFRQSD